MDASSPMVVGIGGSNRSASLTEQLLRTALREAEAIGAHTTMFGGAFLGDLPVFGADGGYSGGAAVELTRAVAAADGLIIASPGYHGGMSGLVKNALDHLEALRDHERPYLDGRAVGLIVNASGWQAGGTALVSLRSTIHALRGWPTPFGATVNSAVPVFSEDGVVLDRVAGALRLVARQVVEFASWRAS
ncbi:MAG: NADPH-dependent FMN reductase [Actinomycetota bacterium]